MNNNLGLKHYLTIMDIYDHIDKVCRQNKKELPPKSSKIYIDLDNYLTHYSQFINIDVLKNLKRNLWYLWKRDLDIKEISKKRGFVACFRMSIEKSIPLSIEDLRTLFAGLETPSQILLEIADSASRAYMKQGMVFQYGSVKTVRVFANYVSHSDFKELCRKALYRAKKDRITPIDWWNYICKWVDDFAGKVLSDSENLESESLSVAPKHSASSLIANNPFAAIDEATEK
jgi:hypothetical protein